MSDIDRINYARRYARTVLADTFASARGVRYVSKREARTVFACAYETALASLALGMGAEGSIL